MIIFSSTLLFLSVITLRLDRAEALSVEIPSGDVECFAVFAKVGSTVSGSFEVLTPDPEPIVVKVMGPEPTRVTQYEMVYSGAGAVPAAASEGNFLFDAETEGEYNLCLRNGDGDTADGVARVIAFNFRTKDHTPGDHDYENIEMESELSDLINGLNFLRDHQHYMNEREGIHRGTLDNIKYKFVVWSLVEYGLLILISLWQIHSILVFFETKRKV
ncbi:unnamed protein product [Ectocarpus fasciculatus]